MNPVSDVVEQSREASRAETIKRSIRNHLTYTLARTPGHATDRDAFVATSIAIRDRLAERWAATTQRYRDEDVKRVHYLSLEFLMGRTLGNAILNLGLDGATAEALEDLGYMLEELQEMEPDAGLGNGGLGRLAACYLDSMATVGIPGYGYGIRYEHGIFHQRIEDGQQVEMPDNWLQFANPWEIERPDRTYTVKFYGRVTGDADEEGRVHYRWEDTHDVLATGYDTPIPGWGGKTVNTLRLWAARATEEFDLKDFFRGDYIAAVGAKIDSENISKVLYPPDDTGQGKELRLRQQYFFVSATLQDIIRRYLRERRTFDDFPDKVQIQLNDTHPAVAVPELMRLFIDDHRMEWGEAWEICQQTFAYTNHTVLPEALESWPIDLFGRMLPRHLEIIGEIDRRFGEEVRRAFPGEGQRWGRMAILGDGQVRMSNLAIVGSHTVNGVAELHTKILRENIFNDFHSLWPDRLMAVTNGVTQRRWIRKANPRLAGILDEAIGREWVTDLARLKDVEPHAEDAEFRRIWRAARRSNKERLCQVITRECGVELDPDSIFDVHVKRLHEYKRQLMNALRIADLYLMLRDDPDLDVMPRTILFGGKAAPTYHTAKLIIRLITSLADTVRAEPATRDVLSVVFVPNYGVTLAERIIPGSDLSEQISTAGYEASGTGNMKFALNGALTIGTWDGANVEIAEQVGEEDMFLFGLKAHEVEERRREGYDPGALYESDDRIRRVLDFIASGELTPNEPELFRPLVHGLLYSDTFMVLADFRAYLDAQTLVDRRYRDEEWWERASIRNVARCGFFSSDRSIRTYAKEIWKV